MFVLLSFLAVCVTKHVGKSDISDSVTKMWCEVLKDLFLGYITFRNVFHEGS
jgi:hypothetical protein